MDDSSVSEKEEDSRPSDITVFAESCTLHGISHIFLPGGVTVRRMLWACAFLMSLSIFLYQVYDRITFYTEYHHVTTLDEMDSPLMTFPAISFCNYNRFRKTQVTKNDLYWMGALLGVKPPDYSKFLETIGQNSDFSKFFPTQTFDMKGFFDRAGHQVETMLLDCRYRSQECGAENFTTVSQQGGWGWGVGERLEEAESGGWGEV
uniref:Uncharacterized protein n=1 Tax=Callorhinchus milii TaxID=7868 RepID=A0A4W3JKD3_CALMI